METPIVDFVKEYVENKGTRFHMPGHKGHVFFGCEPYDITEIKGADVLHHGDGIIAKSQQNASELFGSGATHYSTEGSTHCIKAMLAILMMEHRRGQERPYILAARNVHRSMIDACALLDLDVVFLQQKESSSLCSSVIAATDLNTLLTEARELPIGVYVTSPDYLGQITDIASLSEVCRKFDVPLVADNAHGAYLHFLEEGQHPMDMGAAMCCDSAHKTLPVLTGGAYLHIHPAFFERFEPYAKQALSLFGSTSPSYIIMQSLDLCNRYLAEQFRTQLKEIIITVSQIKKELGERGIHVESSEELKIVIATCDGGYTGEEIAEEMRTYQIECEYADWQHVVLMLTPQNTKEDFMRLRVWAASTVLVCKPKAPLPRKNLVLGTTRQVMTIRDAVLSASEMVMVEESEGRICASETISCPPAIPIAISGEIITAEMIQEFQKFEIEKVCVIRE